MTASETLQAPIERRSARGRTAPHAAAPRRTRRAVSYCNIWDLVAPGEPCPACENSFQQRLTRAAA